jgi:hypothetical protein
MKWFLNRKACNWVNISGHETGECIYWGMDTWCWWGARRRCGASLCHRSGETLVSQWYMSLDYRSVTSLWSADPAAFMGLYFITLPIPVAARSKVWVCGRARAGIMSSNLTGGQGYLSCTVFVLSDRGLCDGPITRPEESYRLWCVSQCDQVKINNLDTCCKQVEEVRTAKQNFITLPGQMPFLCNTRSNFRDKKSIISPDTAKLYLLYRTTCFDLSQVIIKFTNVFTSSSLSFFYLSFNNML